MSKTTRRDFIQVMAFVGAAMASPKLIRAVDLPKPELVHILPESVIANPNEPMIWIDGKALTSCFRFDFKFGGYFAPLFTMTDSHLIPIRQRFAEFRLQCQPSDMDKLYDFRDEKPIEIVVIPSGKSFTGFVLRRAVLESMDFCKDGDGVYLVDATWYADAPETVLAVELMRRVGIADKRVMVRAR